MSRRHFLGLAAALAALSLAADARAGLIPLPSSLDQLIGGPAPAGPYAIVGNLLFSDFTYVPTNQSGGAAPPPPASGITVTPFTAVPGEVGITFNGGIFAPIGATYDFAFSYRVTALTGLINDAYLSFVGGNAGGTGQVRIDETIFDGATGSFLASFGATLASPSAVATWNRPVSSILVFKDVLVVGGTQGATVSIINQGFSTIPEPASMAMLGIGVSGILIAVRLRRRRPAPRSGA